MLSVTSTFEHRRRYGLGCRREIRASVVGFPDCTYTSLRVIFVSPFCSSPCRRSFAGRRTSLEHVQRRGQRETGRRTVGPSAAWCRQPSKTRGAAVRSRCRNTRRRARQGSRTGGELPPLYRVVSSRVTASARFGVAGGWSVTRDTPVRPTDSKSRVNPRPRVPAGPLY